MVRVNNQRTRDVVTSAKRNLYKRVSHSSAFPDVPETHFLTAGPSHWVVRLRLDGGD